MKTAFLAALFAFSVLTNGVTPVHAYTYTCEEGKFQIDVPEGWEVEKHKDDEEDDRYYMNLYSPDGLARILIISDRIYDPDFLKAHKLKSAEEVTIYKVHDGVKRLLTKLGIEILEDEYLDGGDLVNMNLDAGFVIFKDYRMESVQMSGFFIKSYYYYDIGADLNKYKYYDGNGRNVIIKILNSFQALE
jgi:hypothetical protein